MTDFISNIDTHLEDANSVLLLAPALSDADGIACIDLLTEYNPDNENVLSVGVGPSPEYRLSLWQRTVGDEPPSRAAVVDASGEPAATRESPVDAASSAVTVETLPEGAGLIDVGVAIARYLGTWESTPESTVACVHSVSALLDRSPRERVVSLVNSLNDLSETVGATIHYHMDPHVHEPGAVATFRPLCDAVVEHVSGDDWAVTEAAASGPSPAFRGSTRPSESPVADDPPETAPLRYSFDEVLSLLADPWRREVLYHLKGCHPQVVSVAELAEHVHRRGSVDRTGTDAPTAQEVRLSLVHAHLPKLDEASVVDFDADAGSVSYEGNAALTACLGRIERLERG